MSGMKEDVHVRINEEVMGRVRAWAARKGVSLAAAVSLLLSIGLDESES